MRSEEPIRSTPDETSRPGRFDVPAHAKPLTAINENNATKSDETRGARKMHTVYVEADKIEDLRAAYPNYFGDVQVFSASLASVANGKPAREFTKPPRHTAPRPPKEPADFTCQSATAVGRAGRAAETERL